MNEQISINLTSEITYVYGTVNGESVDFYLFAPNIWTTVVPKTVEGIYIVEITAYNNLGTSTKFKTTLYTSSGWLEPKIDWSATDYYNFEDLNRVENNNLYVSELLKKFGVNLTLVSLTDRDLKSIEFADSLNRVENNIEQLAQRYKPPNWITSKTNWTSNTKFNYEDANRLERNLYTLYRHYKRNLEIQPFCGAFLCGEEMI